MGCLLMQALANIREISEPESKTTIEEPIKKATHRVVAVIEVSSVSKNLRLFQVHSHLLRHHLHPKRVHIVP